MYTFHCDQAEPNGSFVAGPLQLNPKQAEGIDVSVYAPRVVFRQGAGIRQRGGSSGDHFFGFVRIIART